MIISPGSFLPQRPTGASLQAPFQGDAAPDQVELGPAPPVPVPRKAEGQAEPGRSLGLRVAGGVGLALVLGGVLTGCGGPTNPPPPPPGQSTNVTSLASRVSQLVKDGKQAEARQMLSSGYYQQVLTRLAASDVPSIAEWAQKGLAEYKLDGDPARMNQAMESALQQIAEGENLPGAARRHQEVARSALKVGDAIEATPLGPAGIFDQVKAEGYKAALEQVLTLPARVDENASGLPREAVRAYLDTLTDLTRTALDTGKELSEPGLQAVVYQATLSEIKSRVQTDGEFLGSEVQKLIELINGLQRLR